MALKIIHTADWHLGQTFFGYSREEEHASFLSWLCDTLVREKADVLLIAGDVFDVSNPSAAAQRQFFHFLKQATEMNPHLQIIIIAGNHDSAARLEAPSPLLEEMNIRIIGMIPRHEDGSIDFDRMVLPLYKQGVAKAWCMAVPFLRQGDYPQADIGVGQSANTYVAGVCRMYEQLYTFAEKKRLSGQALIAIGHLHVSGAELTPDDRSERVILGGLESVPVHVFSEKIAYVGLGHIHRSQQVGGRHTVRYAGSPLSMSFSEKNYKHQVLCVEMKEEDVAEIRMIPVPQMVGLLRLPDKPAAPEDVLRVLQMLPEKDPTQLLPPFLEVQVLLSGPEPTFRHRVEEVLKNKQVRLALVTPSYPERKAGQDAPALTYTDLQKMDPLAMLKRTFAGKYNTDMPQEIQSLFMEVMHELLLKSKKTE